jgi:hypothetical protein
VRLAVRGNLNQCGGGRRVFSDNERKEEEAKTKKRKRKKKRRVRKW